MFVSNIVNISRKTAIIRNKGALFRKENIKKLGFSLKSVMKQFLRNSVGIIGILKFSIETNILYNISGYSLAYLLY